MISLPDPGKDPKLPNAYKPISILPALRKVWEKCLKLLMERCMSMDPFQRKHDAFRRKRSSVDAMTQVMKIADSCKVTVGVVLEVSEDQRRPPVSHDGRPGSWIRAMSA